MNNTKEKLLNKLRASQKGLEAFIRETTVRCDRYFVEHRKEIRLCKSCRVLLRRGAR
jgi:hypothetical protein